MVFCRDIGEGLTSCLLLRWRLKGDAVCSPLSCLYPLCAGFVVVGNVFHIVDF